MVADVASSDVADKPEGLTAAATDDDLVVARTGLRGKPRRTWPQRLLLLSGLLVSAGCFIAGFIFWQANVVLGEVPRISVGPNVLAQAGDPGDPLNILLVGIDSSEGLDEDDPVRLGREVDDEERGIVRPDTILVARVDPATGTASVLSLPRDLIVEVPGGSTARLNATQAVGGIGSLIAAVDSNLSISVNHFVMIDFAGFADIVDIVGGVPVNFPFPTRDLGSGLDITQPGCFNLDGGESLSYVRARTIEEFIDDEWVELDSVSPDLARIERQQEFLVLTAEQILDVGRRDISQIRSFLDAATEAVQLDEALTPGDLTDLAAAFSDFDTEALQIATLPVGAQFSEEGAYIGEQLIEGQASGLLARFQGRDDGVRPPQVDVQVQSGEQRHGEQLSDRGFVVATNDLDSARVSTIRFDVDDQGGALLLARYLEAAPRFVVEPGAALQLEVGPDFAGVRLFPRAEGDVQGALMTAVREANASNQPEAPQTTQPNPQNQAEQSDETSVPGLVAEDQSNVPSTSAEQPNNSVVAQEAPSPLNTVVRGRPLEGVSCRATGG